MISNKDFFSKIFALIIFITAIVLPIYCGNNSSQRFNNTILSNPFFFTGKLISIERAYRRSDTFVFEFYDSKNFQILKAKSSSAMHKYRSIHQYLLGKSFPVIANKDEPQKFCNILICKDDFEEFNLPFPDSLSWVEKLRR